MNRGGIRTAAPLPRSLRSLLSGSLAAGTAAVAVFHLWLLLQRLGDATIGEPGVLLRWLAGSALVAAGLYLRPRGFSLTGGRSALVFWLLVLLLHVGATPVPVTGVDAHELILVLPLGLATALAGVAATAVIGALRAPRPQRRIGRPALEAPAPRCSAGAAPARFSPRPPPLVPAV